MQYLETVILAAIATFGTGYIALVAWNHWQIATTIAILKKDLPIKIGPLVPIRRVLKRGLYYCIFPRHFILLLLLNEDNRFWSHRGFNMPEILRSIGISIRGRTIKGGSSISQQLVSQLSVTNDLRWGYPFRRILNRVSQISATVMLEHLLSKEDILSLYLQSVPFSGGIKGIEGATWAYFNKGVGELSIAESHVLISMISRPKTFIRQQLKLPESDKRRFNYCRAYEKILLCCKILTETSEMETKNINHEIIQRYSHPLEDRSREEYFIGIVTNHIHKIPDALKQIEATPLRFSSFFHSYYSAQICFVLRCFLGSHFTLKDISQFLHINNQIKEIAEFAEAQGVLQLGQFHEIDDVQTRETLSILCSNAKAKIKTINETLLPRADELIARITSHISSLCIVGEYNLVTSYYEHSEQRPLTTLSLLTSQVDVAVCENQLLSAGYQKIGRASEFRTIIEFRGTITRYRHLDSDLKIEILVLNHDDFQMLIDDCVYIKQDNGISYWTPKPIQEFLILVTQMATYRPSALIEIYDSYRILAREALDSKELELRYRNTTLERKIIIPLLMTHFLTPQLFSDGFGISARKRMRAHQNELAVIFSNLFDIYEYDFKKNQLELVSSERPVPINDAMSLF